MSAGTIALTNNSANVTGTGTAFATELKANDFIVVTVGGVTYTLGVKATTSATALTLITPYGGPTATGNAWTAVPNATMVGITAQIAADVSKAIRGLNLDKANWQQVFSGTGTITVTLPDGSTYTGPSWSSLSTSLAGKADTTAVNGKAAKGDNSDITSMSGLTTALSISQGGTGANSKTAAWAALATYGTASGTAAQGNDTRLNTIDGKTGGAVIGQLYTKTISNSTGVSGGIISSVVENTAGSANTQAQLFAQLASGGQRYGFLRVYQDSAYKDWYFDYSGGTAYAPVAWQNNCDVRIKDQIARISNPLERMRKIKGCTWVRKDDQMKGAVGIGLIAQDVLDAFSDIPEVVSHSRQGSLTVDGVEVEDPLGISPGDVSAALHHEAILALMSKIESMEATIADMQNRELTS